MRPKNRRIITHYIIGREDCRKGSAPKRQQLLNGSEELKFNERRNTARSHLRRATGSICRTWNVRPFNSSTVRPRISWVSSSSSGVGLCARLLGARIAALSLYVRVPGASFSATRWIIASTCAAAALCLRLVVEPFAGSEQHENQDRDDHHVIRPTSPIVRPK